MSLSQAGQGGYLTSGFFGNSHGRRQYHRQRAARPRRQPLLGPTVHRLLHPRINHLDPALVISDPAKLSPTLLATFDRENLGRLLGKIDQLTVTPELGEEIAMQHTNLLRC